MDLRGFLDADQSAEGGKEVDGSGSLVLDSAAGDSALPVKDAGNAVPAFELRSFFATEFSAALLTVAPVVGRVDDNGVVELVEFFKHVDEASDGPVCVVDGAAVDCSLIVEIAILGNDLVRRGDRGVRFVEPEIEKEGSLGVAFFIKPGEGLVDDDLAGVAFHHADAFSIADKVGRVFVTWARAVDEAEPIVEAMIGGGGVVAIVYGHTEVPLAEVGGGVAVFLEHFGDGRFALQQVHLVKPFGDDGIDSSAIVVAARKEGGSRRGTGRSARVEIGEAHTPRGQAVENWSLNRPPVTTEVTIPQVVNEQGYDIWMFVLGKTGASQQQKTKDVEVEFHLISSAIFRDTVRPFEFHS